MDLMERRGLLAQQDRLAQRGTPEMLVPLGRLGRQVLKAIREFRVLQGRPALD